MMRARIVTGTWIVALALSACGSEREERLASLQPMEARGEMSESEQTSAEVPRITAVRFNPERPRAGRSVTAVVETSSAGTVQLKYEWRVRGLAIDGVEAVDLPSGRPGDLLEVVVTPMQDGRAGSSFSHQARISGLAPRIGGIRLNPPRGLTAGSQVTAEPILDDVDPRQVNLQYQWSVNGRRTFERDATLSTEGLRRGDRISVEVTARVGTDVTAPYRSEELVLANASPRVVADPLSQDTDGVVRTRLRATDPDGDRPIRFKLAKGPRGLELDSLTGEIRWNPSDAPSGRHAVEVEVSDAQGGVTRSKFDLQSEGDALPAAPAPR